MLVHEQLPAVATLVGVVSAVAAVALGVHHHLAAPGALQHLATAGAQVLPEGAELQHQALC